MNRFLDHAVLKPEMSQSEVVAAIKLGLDYQVKTICVRPCDLELTVAMCKNSDTEACCVLSFPHGTGLSETKAYEAELYASKGVHEIDMVANYGYIRSGAWDLVERDIKVVSAVTKPAGIILKVILETNTLTAAEIAQATLVAIKANADFVKTSTGFNGSGATTEAVQVMLTAAQGRIKVKASGGIRDRETAQMYLDMGVERLGVGYTTTPVLVGGASESKVNPKDY